MLEHTKREAKGNQRPSENKWNANRVGVEENGAKIEITICYCVILHRNGRGIMFSRKFLISHFWSWQLFFLFYFWIHSVWPLLLLLLVLFFLVRHFSSLCIHMQKGKKWCEKQCEKKVKFILIWKIDVRSTEMWVLVFGVIFLSLSFCLFSLLFIYLLRGVTSDW